MLHRIFGLLRNLTCKPNKISIWKLTTEAVLNLGWWRRKTKPQLAQVESRAGGDRFDN